MACSKGRREDEIEIGRKDSRCCGAGEWVEVRGKDGRQGGFALARVIERVDG